MGSVYNAGDIDKTDGCRQAAAIPTPLLILIDDSKCP